LKKVVATFSPAVDSYTKAPGEELITSISISGARNFSVGGCFGLALLLCLGSGEEPITQLEPVSLSRLKRLRRPSFSFSIERG